MATHASERKASAASIPVHNPSDGSLLGEIEETPPEVIERAVAAARAAQPKWATLPYRRRAEGLKRLARRIRDDRVLMEVLVGESGKPAYEAEIFEMLYLLDLTRFYASRTCERALADDMRDVLLLPHKRARVTYHARGVVGVIGPWNWPLLNNFADCVAPLMAGNAVVLKPSEYTPLTSLRIRELWIEEGLPPDVFQVVTGRGDAGRAVVEHADMIFFTGSDRTGRLVAKRAAERLVPCVLELGGKSALIVLADADLPRAARAAVWSGFAHSGQVCIRTERIFVEASVSERFTELCQQEVVRLRHGADGGPHFDVGAMTFPPQMDHIAKQVADAVEQGGRLLSGGKKANSAGNHFEPTLIGDANLSMKVMTEESFGPILPIMTVQSAEEAIRLTNESHLGLSGSVWSQDLDKARAVARRIESGSVCINDVLVNYLCVEAPLGGVKASGIGLRHGIEGLKQFCRIETIVEDRGPITAVSGLIGKLLGFPYDQRLLDAARWYMKRRY